ncbi:aBC-type transport system involved in Fe-S cluster assembly permease component [Mycoplasma sp. CAG:776]|nr:aBC-type transport system involved in Fe-S cluster assembly permease component [Mycoplasma sp. CAG:776]
MNNLDKELLKKVSENFDENKEVYNIRKNGKSIERKVNSYIDIVNKEDKSGIDIYVKENTLFGIIHIPVIITESGLTDVVYNDFHIGKNANVIIFAGCGIHNDLHKDSEHDGIHRFFLEEGAKVKYVEKHYGEGKGRGKRVLNPTTEIYMKKGSTMNMDSVQIKGVDNTLRVTKAVLEEDTTLEISEKILTTGKEKAKTEFIVDLNGENASVHVTSRSVAEESSYQEFISNVTGNTKCYAHIECDAIIKDEGKVKAIPEIYAKNIDANLIHEAAIGKIAGEQLKKLMTLGLNEKEAEEVIIKGFLK